MTSGLQISEIEPYKYMQCLTKEQSQFNGERIVFSKSGAEPTGHQYGKNI